MTFRPALLLGSLLCACIAATPAEAVKRRAFVTSVQGNGNLASWDDAGGAGALTAADNVCRARAAAASLPNASTYRAWLSTAATDAYCHVRGQTGKKSNGCVGTPVPAGPWYRVNGTTPFTGPVERLTGPEQEIYQDVRWDELGNTLDHTDPYWTGTRASGEASTATCTSWVVGAEEIQGTRGVPNTSAQNWTNNMSWGCNSFHRLLCLEPGASEEPVVPWTPAALTFVTSAWGTGDLSSWEAAGGATGIEAGDAICRNLAGTAGLPAPDSFFAWLSDPTTDAADRMTLVNRPFRRVDHFLFAVSKATLLGSGSLTSLHVTERGEYIGDHGLAWTGTLADGSRAGAGNYCNSWATGDTTAEGMFGRPSVSLEGDWTEFLPTQCHQPIRLYCFSNIVTIFWDGFELTGDTSRWSTVLP